MLRNSFSRFLGSGLVAKRCKSKPVSKLKQLLSEIKISDR
ncbi:hypothetical protein APA_338 [Pseudanabaena sp. lw0831]|nr:hypothetical protein APA_338 [Pseudanabaena sp. lw0831]